METERERRGDHKGVCFREPGGGQFIQILNVRPLADGKRRFSSWLRGLAWQYCEACSMFDEAAEKQHPPRPCTATIVRQMTTKTTAFFARRGTENPTSHMRLQ